MKGNLQGGNTPERHDELFRRIMTGTRYWPRGVEVDPALKDLCDRMLHKDLRKRLGSIVVAPEDGTQMKNDEIREHPFMLGFPWHAMYGRKLVVSTIT